MLTETFDLPDGSDVVLARAEAFLREQIEALGGELFKHTRDFMFEPKCFEARFYDVNDDAREGQDAQENAHWLAVLYSRLDMVQELYAAEFGQWL